MAAAVLCGPGCGSGDSPEPAPPTSATDAQNGAPPDRPAPTVTVAPEPAPPREPPRRLSPAAESGTVRVEEGPFTDQLRIEALRVRSGERPRVTGRMARVTDVSELLLLQLEADFYDRRGRYLASGTATIDDPEAFHEGDLSFSVAARRPARRAVAAILTVPQLISE